MKSFYSLMLHLFPKAYRSEYGHELQMVFNSSLDDAMKNGGPEVIVLIVRELIGLPKAIMYEHLRERRKVKMSQKFTSRFDFPQGSRNEFLAVLASFILPIVVILCFYGLVNYFGVVPARILWLNIVFAVIFFGSLFGVFAVGLMVGLPRWFLPYMGFILAIMGIFTYSGFVDPNWNPFPSLHLAPRFVQHFVYEGLHWIGLIVLLILMVLFAALIPRFRSFYSRLREDWTLIAFIVYGTVPLAIFMTFDDYQNEGLYVLTANAVLAIGGWIYLRNHVPWKRFLSLFIGLTISMAIPAMGKYILYIPRAGFGFTKLSEVLATVTTWIWLALIMLISFAINLLPQAKSHAQSIELVTD